MSEGHRWTLVPALPPTDSRPGFGLWTTGRAYPTPGSAAQGLADKLEREGIPIEDPILIREWKPGAICPYAPYAWVKDDDAEGS